MTAAFCTTKLSKHGSIIDFTLASIGTKSPESERIQLHIRQYLQKGFQLNYPTKIHFRVTFILEAPKSALLTYYCKNSAIRLLLI